ncbi:Helix-turn-helix domain-containing protein [Ruminococcaceae bacterium YRB3002]|nr:Helix-turn-helix domain-containing protein [Ruminococcaceae bacterium YRB3002]
MLINKYSDPRDTARELVRRLREYRISMELTQEDLADMAMVSVKTISRFENGEEIGLSKFVRILHVLELSENIDLLVPDPDIRPMNHTVDREGRRRARHKDRKPDNSWKWGDES